MKRKKKSYLDGIVLAVLLGPFSLFYTGALTAIVTIILCALMFVVVPDVTITLPVIWGASIFIMLLEIDRRNRYGPNSS